MRSRTDMALRCFTVAVTAAALALVAGVGQGRAAEGQPAVAPQLLAQAKSQPAATFRVIASGRDGWTSERVANLLTHLGHASVAPGGLLRSVRGVAASLSGADLAKLAGLQSGLLAIAPDSAVTLTDFSNDQEWAKAVQAPQLWAAASGGRPTPGIAIVDSGIDAGRSDFGGRPVKSVSLTSSEPNSPGDGYGHGTFVAALAAGAAGNYAGAAPTAPLVSLDVVDDNGHAFTSDVIRAIDWIIANRTAYDIRVANFSLESAAPGTIRFDPLNAAVERLWLSGVVVVAAAGNSRTGDAPNGIAHAPANDPFVITVGALDLGAGGADTSDDTAAPWSSYGYTNDGFLKPELSAPGRGLVAAVPLGSKLGTLRADAVVDQDHLRLSGTSFSAPIVAGTAAMLLAQNPTWTPDQVKGALMVSAHRLPAALPHSVGFGEVSALRALAVTNPPNPNRALDQFVVAAADGTGRVFDAASWTDAAKTDASWTDASWTDASWTDASWTDASWTDASWTDASWTDASWTDASWTSASWTDASWTDASWTDASWTDASWTDMSWLR